MAALLADLVLLVGYLFHPVDNLTVEMFLDCDVRYGRGWRSAVPVLLARRKTDHVARPDLLDGASPALYQAAAKCYDQGLPQRMGVPGGTRARLEGDVSAAGTRIPFRLEEGVNAHRAGEVFVRSLG